MSVSTISRWEAEGIIQRERNGLFSIAVAVPSLLHYFMTRHRFAFRLLREFHIFDESTGDTIEGWTPQSWDE